MADDGLTPCDTLPFVTTILTVRYKQVIVTTCAPSASINYRKLYLIVNYTTESKLQQFGTIFLLENGFKNVICDHFVSVSMCWNIHQLQAATV